VNFSSATSIREGGAFKAAYLISTRIPLPTSCDVTGKRKEKKLYTQIWAWDLFFFFK
jgi:hypothetical protein